MTDVDAKFREDQVNEPDLDTKAMGVLGIYTTVLTTIFFVTVAALIPYFKWEAARTLDARINTVENETLKAARAGEDEVLAGKGKGAAISIDEAMRRTVKDLSRK